MLDNGLKSGWLFKSLLSFTVINPLRIPQTRSFSSIQYELFRRNNQAILKSGSSKLGIIYLKSARRNLFCSLLENGTNKVKTSCSLKVPPYINEYNERENLGIRGRSLGEVFSKKVLDLGYKKALVYIIGRHRGRFSFMLSIKKSKLFIINVVQLYNRPHNGCRPSAIRRKKVRTKVRPPRYKSV